jgi:cytoskeletal protein CcmA (bactofilin family)
MAYIGVSPSNGVRKKHTYTATASQTSFSGAGAEGITLAYRDSNYVDVYQNGVKLADEDYTATSGTAIVLAQGASADDIVEIIAFDVFSVADTVSKADGGTFDGNVTMAGTLGVTGVLTGTSLDISGDIDVDGTTNLDVVDIDGAVDMATTLAVAGNVDFNGDLDVDGTTNLDVVDIDGAVDMATTLLVAGNTNIGTGAASTYVGLTVNGGTDAMILVQQFT